MNIYVCYSGRPVGEMYHREIGVVFAESEEEARSYIEIDNPWNQEWLWGPHVNQFDTVQAAMENAVLHATDDRGQVYSHLFAAGEHIDTGKIVDDMWNMAYAKQDERAGR